jgi:hypothetical protein
MKDLNSSKLVNILCDVNTENAEMKMLIRKKGEPSNSKFTWYLAVVLFVCLIIYWVRSCDTVPDPDDDPRRRHRRFDDPRLHRDSFDPRPRRDRLEDPRARFERLNNPRARREPVNPRAVPHDFCPRCLEHVSPHHPMTYADILFILLIIIFVVAFLSIFVYFVYCCINILVISKRWTENLFESQQRF